MLELTPFGGVMTYPNGKSPSKGIKGICVAGAGPAANYLLLAIAASLTEVLDYDLLYAITLSNAVMLIVNLLPAFPLDGGRVIFCLGYYIFPVSRLIECLSWMGVFLGIGFVFLALYGAISLGVLNCSVVIVGVYLAYSARKSRMQMMMENVYSIVMEREHEKRFIRPFRAYAVSADTQLIRLVPYISEAYACEFILSNDRKELRISEKMLCKNLLKHPMDSMEDIFLQ